MIGAVIVSGGSVDEVGMLKMLHDVPDSILFAADKGVEMCVKHNLIPEYVIGDFDSVSDMARTAMNHWGVPVTTLKPEKDDTDTEAALRLALKETKGDVVIFGGTGTRLDHVLGNISILGLGFAEGRQIILQDHHNRIRLLDRSYTISKEVQYGDFISIFPYTTEVKGLTLEGVKYPLKDFTLKGYTSIGVSNEIIEDEAHISFTEGVLILVESKDN